MTVTTYPKLTPEQTRVISAILWPDATEPGTPTEDANHEPEIYLDDEEPERFEVLACSCQTELARIPRGGHWRSIFEEHLRAVGQ